MSDAREMTDYEVASAIGEKAMEMAERVKVIDTMQPGVQAKWHFAIDDTAFDMVITVRREAKS